MFNIVFFCFFLIFCFLLNRAILSRLLINILAKYDRRRTVELHYLVRDRISNYSRPTKVGIFLNSVDINNSDRKETKTFMNISNNIEEFYYIGNRKNYFTIDPRQENFKLFGYCVVYEKNKPKKIYNVYLEEI